ncbi:site-specific integrase [Paraburkholderia sp. C35]|uniref:site-specific integrase n=1 Tax=Paraburkholderia sp. C35 TaxID=2126993 RepID=UPI000D693F6C|nr:site-specific integrase [Paraburkholderia sp. C35]
MNITQRACETIASITAHGASKQDLQEKKLDKLAVRSVGTERTYRQAFKGYLRWLIDNRISLDDAGFRPMMLEYLEEFAEGHAQKSVNQAKNMLEKVYSVRLPWFESCIPAVVQRRAYDFDQVERLIAFQTPQNQLSTLLCYDAGLRSHECITLRERALGKPSPRRNWTDARFCGRTDVEVFLVTGKGGLTREVAISTPLARELRKYARPHPTVIRDREIEHLSYFEIGGGQALSTSFSRASQIALGWTRGVHGLRHSFAHNRMRTLIPLVGAKLALEILSQELGHFRPEICLAYLVGR